MIIAVDFDGTCVDHRFPDVGPDVPLCAQTLKDLTLAGHQLILWTMRSDNRKDGTNPLTEAINWFRERQIPLYGIQRNPSQDEWTSSPKCYANVYIDDAAFGAPLVSFPEFHRPAINWLVVREFFQI